MQTRVEEVKPLFVQPDWYLRKKRYNIRARAETVQQFLNGAQFGSTPDIARCGFLHDDLMRAELLAAVQETAHVVHYFAAWRVSAQFPRSKPMK